MYVRLSLQQRSPSILFHTALCMFFTFSFHFFLAVEVTCFTSSITCTSTNRQCDHNKNQPAGQCCLNRGGRSYRTGTSTVCTPCAGKCLAISCFRCAQLALLYSVRVLSVPHLHPTVHQHIPEGRVAAHRILWICERNVPRKSLRFFQCTEQQVCRFGSCTTLHTRSAVGPRYIKSFTTGVLTTGAARQQFTLNIISDNTALQPPLSIPVSATVDGFSEFVLPFNAVLLDTDGRECGHVTHHKLYTYHCSCQHRISRIRLQCERRGVSSRPVSQN